MASSGSCDALVIGRQDCAIETRTPQSSFTRIRNQWLVTNQREILFRNAFRAASRWYDSENFQVSVSDPLLDLEFAVNQDSGDSFAGVTVTVDRLRFERSMLNLCTNSISNSGAIVVHIDNVWPSLAHRLSRSDVDARRSDK